MGLQRCETYTRARNTLQLSAKRGRDSLSSENPFSSPLIPLHTVKTEKKKLILMHALRLILCLSDIFCILTPTHDSMRKIGWSNDDDKYFCIISTWCSTINSVSEILFQRIPKYQRP